MSNKLDLFSLFEDVIIESSDVDIEVPYEEKMSDADSFYDEMKRSKLVAKNKSNSKVSKKKGFHFKMKPLFIS